MANSKTPYILGAILLGGAGAAFAAYKSKQVTNAIANLEVTISAVKPPEFELGFPQKVIIPLVVDVRNPSGVSGSFRKAYGRFVMEDGSQLGSFEALSDSGKVVTVPAGGLVQIKVSPKLDLANTLSLINKFFQKTGKKEINNRTINAYVGQPVQSSVIDTVKDILGNIFNRQFTFGVKVTAYTTIVLTNGVELSTDKTFNI